MRFSAEDRRWSGRSGRHPDGDRLGHAVDADQAAVRADSPGKQALTISTGNVQGVNGFIKAGDRINMIITIDIEFSNIPVGQQVPTLPTEGEEPGQETEEVTVTYTRYVLQGILVLAVGTDIRVDEEDQTGQVPATTPTGEEEQVASTVFTSRSRRSRPSDRVRLRERLGLADPGPRRLRRGRDQRCHHRQPVRWRPVEQIFGN